MSCLMPPRSRAPLPAACAKSTHLGDHLGVGALLVRRSQGRQRPHVQDGPKELRRLFLEPHLCRVLLLQHGHQRRQEVLTRVRLGDREGETWVF